MQTSRPTVVIADDAPEVRALVRTTLRIGTSFVVVGEAVDGDQAIALAREHQPSVVLLDASMPGSDGLQALPSILKVSPTTQVVLYSGFEEQGLAEKAFALGAADFIPKSAPVESLAGRLTTLLEGSQPYAAGGSAAAQCTDVSPPGTEAAGTHQLHDHLERFREVFDQAAIGMATMTLTGRLVRVNQALAAVLGRRSDDLIGAPYAELTDGHEDQVMAAVDDINALHRDVVELEHGLNGVGAGRRVRAILASVRDTSGRPLYLFLQAQDVTTERVALEELRRSEERFRLLVEAVQDYAIFMLDPDGHIISWNSGAQRSKGYTAEEIIGKHFRIFYPPDVQAAQHPEHELQLALREGHYEEEGWRIRKDGSRFWANVLITAVFNAAGEHIGFTKVTRDTTERRRLAEEREHAVHALATANAELEALNERLRGAADDQARFLAVTAHELRTPVGVLGGSADLLSKHWNELSEADRHDLLAAMGSSTDRLRRLLADLLTASRLQASAMDITTESIPISRVVADAVSTVHRTWPEADIKSSVSADLTVKGDRDRLAQALDNLLGNAIRHGVQPIHLTAEPDGDYVLVRVSDEGLGVPSELRARLFDRFATGTSKGGTGLGLFIVRELARAHGGDAVYEEPSRTRPAGAFVLRIPGA